MWDSGELVSWDLSRGVGPQNMRMNGVSVSVTRKIITYISYCKGKFGRESIQKVPAASRGDVNSPEGIPIVHIMRIGILTGKEPVYKISRMSH